MAVIRLALLAALLAQPAIAAPPPNIVPDPALEAWFKSLREPGTNYPCCSVSDCRFTEVEIKDGHYQVQIDDWTYTVPPERIISGIVNLTGRAVVCYTYGSFGLPSSVGPQDFVEILCFVPPRLPS